MTEPVPRRVVIVPSPDGVDDADRARDRSAGGDRHAKTRRRIRAARRPHRWAGPSTPPTRSRRRARLGGEGISAGTPADALRREQCRSDEVGRRSREADRVPVLRALAARSPGSQVRTGAGRPVQSVELAVAAEELGVDGAYVRVHHFARQLASPFPLLAAMAARTSRIEIGTGVIDMRYENPLYMAEEAAAADLLSDGRLQLGVSRGSPETALRGSEAFGYVPPDGQQRRRPRPGQDGAVPRRVSRADRRGRRPADDRRRRAAGWRSSRSRRAWPTASGGARAPARRPSGRRSRA